jgi:F0F1-type ATP synthase delta subunit
VPHFLEDDRILGGVVVRVGDRVMDGSLRRRLDELRLSLARSGLEASTLEEKTE